MAVNRKAFYNAACRQKLQKSTSTEHLLWLFSAILYVKRWVSILLPQKFHSWQVWLHHYWTMSLDRLITQKTFQFKLIQTIWSTHIIAH